MVDMLKRCTKKQLRYQEKFTCTAKGETRVRWRNGSGTSPFRPSRAAHHSQHPTTNITDQFLNRRRHSVSGSGLVNSVRGTEPVRLASLPGPSDDIPQQVLRDGTGVENSESRFGLTPLS